MAVDYVGQKSNLATNVVAFLTNEKNGELTVDDVEKICDLIKSFK